MRRALWFAVMTMALLGLAGCSGWLIGETQRLPTWQLPPVSATQPASETTPVVDKRLVVLAPRAAAVLNGLSPVVVAPDGALSVVGQTRWADRPSVLLQQRLRQRLAQSGRFADVAVESYQPRDELRLHLALQGFHVEVDNNGELFAVGNWTLRLPDQRIRPRQISVRQAVDGDSAKAIMQALQTVALEMVEQGADAVLAMQDTANKR